MKTIYTLAFVFFFSVIILFNKILDNLMVFIYILGASIIIGIIIKSFAKKEAIKDFGFGLFLGSLGTSILFVIGLIYLTSTLH